MTSRRLSSDPLKFIILVLNGKLKASPKLQEKMHKKYTLNCTEKSPQILKVQLQFYIHTDLQNNLPYLI